ncbi:hypothetical protein CEXT_761191 [Caerostris extrusa]|uniref:Uncharacterized protein n=1 Tax=Caerostris extrusa TaxID=172846 RepID=A0AAV4PZR3_CAEEX|nr:hypothetical protein CEXT_761191 [Caerostris extrusa]
MYYSDSQCRNLSSLQVPGDEQHNSDEKLLPEGDKLLSVCLAPIHNAREREPGLSRPRSIRAILNKISKNTNSIHYKMLPLFAVCLLRNLEKSSRSSEQMLRNS